MEFVEKSKAVVINELISLLASQPNIPSVGLLELKFMHWKQISETLDDAVLQSLAWKCNSLSKLEIINMNKLSDANRMAVA